mmetsp:Transcript_11590/g.26827  ORF Transcript_11590/g.26827 Transcript_11590/m.26827 type:complete len:165 (-) Transcript_11590:442-936(-)
MLYPTGFAESVTVPTGLLSKMHHSQYTKYQSKKVPSATPNTLFSVLLQSSKRRYIYGVVVAIGLRVYGHADTWRFFDGTKHLFCLLRIWLGSSGGVVVLDTQILVSCVYKVFDDVSHTILLMATFFSPFQHILGGHDSDRGSLRPLKGITSSLVMKHIGGIQFH